MGKLDKSVVYLSGAMEFVSDHGVGWRRKFIQLINENNLKIDCIDPTNKPSGKDLNISEDKEIQVRLQDAGCWQELQEYVDTYRRYDLRFVDISDFIVAVIDPKVPQWGTSNEIYEAERQHKPIFFVIEGGMRKLPRWLFGVIDLPNNKGLRCNVFETIEDVIHELKGLDSGLIPLNKEWVLVRSAIEDSRVYEQKSQKSKSFFKPIWDRFFRFF